MRSQTKIRFLLLLLHKYFKSYFLWTDLPFSLLALPSLITEKIAKFSHWPSKLQLSLSPHINKFWASNVKISFPFPALLSSQLLSSPVKPDTVQQNPLVETMQTGRAGWAEFHWMCQFCPHSLLAAAPHTGSRDTKTGFALQSCQKQSQPQPICINQQ